MKRFLLSLIALAYTTLLSGHGFSSDTLVLLAGNGWQQISTVCYRTQKKKIAVASYNTTASYQTTSKTIRGGRSKSNCFIRFGFEERFKDSQLHEVACTPTQEFYSATTHQWIPAYKLKIGDELLCASNTTKTVAYISLIKEPLDIYTIEVKHTHTFFVTHHSLLTHNMVIPVAFSLGVSIPFGASAGGAAGGFFGPITFLVGAAIGCAVGALVKIVCNSKLPTYTVDAYNANTFDQYVKQQPQVATFSEPHVTLSPDYKETQQITDATAGEAYGEYTFSDDNENTPCFSITIHNPPKEKPGCGDTTPQKPLILIVPADPMPVFQNPGYRPLSDEERKMLSGGGCTIISIPAQKKEDFILTMTAEDARKRWAESDEMKELEKRIKELEKTVSHVRPGDWRALIDRDVLDLIKDNEWAESMYKKIRSSNDDVKKVADNLGISTDIIQAIKDHLFITSHKRDGKIDRFSEDYDIAKAWAHLIEGTFVKADLILLRHELAEFLLMGKQEMSYESAHPIVESFVSWLEEL